MDNLNPDEKELLCNMMVDSMRYDSTRAANVEYHNGYTEQQKIEKIDSINESWRNKKVLFDKLFPDYKY